MTRGVKVAIAVAAVVTAIGGVALYKSGVLNNKNNETMVADPAQIARATAEESVDKKLSAFKAGMPAEEVTKLLDGLKAEHSAEMKKLREELETAKITATKEAVEKVLDFFRKAPGNRGSEDLSSIELSRIVEFYPTSNEVWEIARKVACTPGICRNDDAFERLKTGKTEDCPPGEHLVKRARTVWEEVCVPDRKDPPPPPPDEWSGEFQQKVIIGPPPD